MQDRSSRDSAERLKELEKLIGRTIAGKYAVSGLIGRGGMGAVYEAEHIGLGKKVAMKFVDASFAQDETVASRFAREARAASAIESAHIVSVFDTGTEDGQPYLVMELLRGEDVGTRLRRKGRLPLDESLHIVAQILRGLSCAHRAGIVHRDLKPDNVFLVSTDGDPLFTKIVDFGISKIQKLASGTVPLALTGKGTVLGTPLYMSPEQAQALADVDARADLYSVGAILFECLAGRPPHTGESYEQVILSICMSDAPDVRTIDPKIPEDVAKLVARSLQRDRALRFQSAAAMLVALHEASPEEKLRVPIDSLTGEPHPAPGDSTPPPAPREVEPALAATEVAAGPPTDVSWSAISRPPASGEPRASRPRPARSRVMVPLTAALATLTGIGVTLGVLTAIEPGPTPRVHVAADASAVTVHSAIGAAPPAISAARAIAPESPATPSSSVADPPAPSAAPKHAPAPPSSGTKPAAPLPATKGLGGGLDIQREMP